MLFIHESAPFFSHPSVMGTCSACENGGTCQVEGSSTFSCLCPPSYTGLYCEVPLEPSCPDDICTAVYTSSFTIFRDDEGDIIELASDSAYCSSIRGNCMKPVPGRDLCRDCHCDFRYTYREDTEMCEDYYSGKRLQYFSDTFACTSYHFAFDFAVNCHELWLSFFFAVCPYRFSRAGLSSDTGVSTLYFVQSNDRLELFSIATDARLHVVRGTTELNIPSGCSVESLEVLTQRGWVNISSQGFTLSTESGSGRTFVEVCLPVGYTCTVW